jgi:vesicle-fusing ATPase
MILTLSGVVQISPEDLVNYNEQGKCSRISKYFEDAYKSPLSVIVIDDVERLLGTKISPSFLLCLRRSTDYVGIGPRFSNAVLQALLVLVKKYPPKGRRLLILATTSNKDVLEAMGFMEVFNQILHIPDVEGGKEAASVLSVLKVRVFSSIRYAHTSSSLVL